MSDKDQDDNFPDTDVEADEANEFSDLSIEEGEDDPSFYEEDEGLAGDEEFIEEDWEAYDDEFVEEEAPAPKKKNRNRTNWL